jgi:DNA topoisomerase-2
LIDALEKELVILSNKARYIQELLDDTIDLRKKKKVEIVDMLQTKGYSMIENDNEYKYLVRMPMDSVSEENVNKLNKEHKDKSDELKRIREITIQQMWLSELHELCKEYIQYREERTQTALGISEKKKGGSKIVSKQGGIKKMVKKGIVNLVEE